MELSETGAESACPVPPDHVEVAGTGDPAPWTPDCVTDVQSGPPGGPVVTSKDTAGPEASGSAEETGPGAALDQQDGSLTQYRDDGSEDFSSDSDSDSSSSSSSSSSSGGPLHIVLEDIDYEDAGVGNGRKQTPLKTQDELLVEDLPAVEELAITLPESTVLQPVGTISSIIDKLVIIQSLKDIPPLNDDTVIFNKDRLAIGRVFEVFGPVVQPFYVLRFNSEEHIQQKELRTQETMYFAPDLTDLTAYIFTEQLKQLKGSDASWKNDQEPPPEVNFCWFEYRCLKPIKYTLNESNNFMKYFVLS
uniref:H/ACA ribonucleoprotein complex subunit n=1 Tax=Denticeps clupeoides TaxID=299321 RepID=A0AAY4DCF6_9TELE